MDQQTTRTTFISILAAVQSYRQRKRYRDTEQKLRQVDNREVILEIRNGQLLD